MNIRKIQIAVAACMFALAACTTENIGLGVKIGGVCIDEK